MITDRGGAASKSKEPLAKPGRTGRAIRLLQKPLLPLWLAALGMVLTLPALQVGLLGDDLYHRSVLHGARVFNDLAPSASNMFRFFDGDPQRTLRMIDLGSVPWFAWPAAKGSFWRPLTVLTHWLDYQLWPKWPVLMHAQSILWFGALIGVVTLFYRRLMTERLGAEGRGAGPGSSCAWVAGLAALLYTIDDARGLPVGFLANRNTLICTFFGVLAITAHDRWRRGARRAGTAARGKRPGILPKAGRVCAAATGPALLALSLFAKEEGVGVCAYLLAYALFLDRGSWRERLVSLTPYVALVAAWRIAWTGLGYGVVDIGFYVDPLREPVRFLGTVFERGPLLLLGQWGLPPAELTLLLGRPGRMLLWGLAVFFLSVVAWLLVPLIRGGEQEQSDGPPRRPGTELARFWAVGMVLAIVPVCTTFPADRMLSFAGLGAMGLLAQFLAAGVQHGSGARTRSALTAGLVGVHLVLAPVMLPLSAGWPTGPGWSTFEIRTPLDASIAGQDLVLVNPPSVMHVAYFIVERDFAGLPVPRHVRQLASGRGPLTMSRLDEHTLELRPKDGFGGWAFERLFRTARHPFRAGDRIDLTGMRIDITEVTADGRPAVACFRFGVPLEDSSLRWLAFADYEFQPLIPPRVGESVQLAGW